MNEQKQPLWERKAGRVIIFIALCISSLLGLFCLIFPFWGRSIILAPPTNNIGGFSGIDLDPTCIQALSYTFPILIGLMCLVLVILNAMGFIRGRVIYLIITIVVSTFLLLFFFSTPFWSYLFIWGDGFSGTGCEIFIEHWFPNVGTLASLALLGLNLLGNALLLQKKQIT